MPKLPPKTIVHYFNLRYYNSTKQINSEEFICDFVVLACFAPNGSRVMAFNFNLVEDSKVVWIGMWSSFILSTFPVVLIPDLASVDL